MAENYISNGKSRGIRGQPLRALNGSPPRIARGGGASGAHGRPAEPTYRDLSISWRNREECGNVRGRGFPASRGRGYNRPPGQQRPSNVFEGPFADPQTLETWAVYCFDDYNHLSVDQDDLNTFVEEMIKNGKKRGMEFKIPLKIEIQILNDMDDVDIFFEDIARSPDFQRLELIFIGIPNQFKNISTDTVYKYIKHYSDSEMGIVSQCFKAEYVKEIPSEYFSNFLQKVNAKLGGLNKIYDPRFLQSVPLDLKSTMIVGVVNHSAELNKLKQDCSIAVGVGSYDNVFSKYSACVHVQRSQADDTIHALDTMIRELMQSYRIKNGGYPKNLILFRDGITRAQLESFITCEMEPIEKYLTSLKDKIQTNFYVIVVQKRRPPPTNTRPNRKITFPCKTVIDRGVHESQSDVIDLEQYYGREDKSKLTKFIMVRQPEPEASPLTKEELKKLIYYSCQNYSRSTSAIDIPTCIRYSDLCAGRTKMHANYKLDEMVKAGKKESIDSIIKQLDHAVQMDQNVKNSLYYC